MQRAAISTVVGSASPSPGLSVLGRAALSPAQLTTWYSATGYADLTTATIDQLTDWYASQGVAEDVRADVAFAQAVLETGGFSSPDAVTLNNYAGIGHCDSCSAGWAFPSPEGGVLGQLQLLRIFADPGGTPQNFDPAVAWRAVLGPAGDIVIAHQGGTDRVIDVAAADQGVTQVPTSTPEGLCRIDHGEPLISRRS